MSGGEAPISAINRQIAERLAADFDVEVAKAVSARLGHSRWTPDQLRGRLHEIRVADSWTTLHLDGEPLLQYGDVEVVMDGVVMTARRQFARPN